MVDLTPQPAVRRWLSRVAFVVVLASILYEAFDPRPVITTTFNHEDKLFHGSAFIALVITMRAAFPRGAWWAQVCWALGIGIGIELVQSLEPTRVASFWDVVADACGIAIGWLILQWPLLRRWTDPG